MGKHLAVKFPAGNSWSELTGKSQREEAGRGWRWRRARLGGMWLGWEQRWNQRVMQSASCLASILLWPCTEAAGTGSSALLCRGQAIDLNVYQHPQTAPEMAPASCKTAGERGVLPGPPHLASPVAAHAVAPSVVLASVWFITPSTATH